jgi:hypothetical protein
VAPAQLATVVDLERLTGRSWATEHERAEEALDVASGLVRGHCGWPVSAFVAREEVLDGDGVPLIALACPRVTAVTRVEVEGRPVGAFTWSRNGLVATEYHVPEGLGNVRVVYSGGYDEVPAAVRAVAISVALRSLNADTSGEESVAQEAVGPLSWSYRERSTDPATELTGAELAALAPYALDRTGAEAAQ